MKLGNWRFGVKTKKFGGQIQAVMIIWMLCILMKMAHSIFVGKIRKFCGGQKMKVKV